MNTHILEQNGLVGTLYSPDSPTKLPAVILISGSDGGLPGTNAIPEPFIHHLVEQGLTVFALAYFGIKELPTSLEFIPLEYFETALKWLRSQPDIEGKKIAIIGQSRGAELALLLASTMPHLVQAVVACAPSNMVCGGFPHPNRPAWRYKNRPITPYLSALSGSDPTITELDDLTAAMKTAAIAYHANTAEDPCCIADLYAARQKEPIAIDAQIAVEHILCPILLLSGSSDAIWPSEQFYQQIVTRLEAKGSRPCRLITYQNAGHGILASYQDSIYHPVGGFWCRLGGTIEGNLEANKQSWIDIVEFLRNLK